MTRSNTVEWVHGEATDNVGAGHADASREPEMRESNLRISAKATTSYDYADDAFPDALGCVAEFSDVRGDFKHKILGVECSNLDVYLVLQALLHRGRAIGIFQGETTVDQVMFVCDQAIEKFTPEPTPF